MKKTNNILIILLALFAFSCDDIVEEDIENDTIQTIFPTENIVIEGNTVQFAWRELDGADDYRVQVIDDNQLLVVDSLVAVTTIDFVLNPGNYQWRVKGENFAYSTEYTFPINFSVEASDDLTNQSVVLLTPSDDHYTNDTTNIILTWSTIINTDYYSLDVIKNNGGQETVLQETNITSSNFTIPSSVFIEDSEYIWKIKAFNSTSESNFSERSFFTDRQTPSQPSLVSPSNLEITTETIIDFNWTIGSDSGNVQSTRTNTFEVSTDINFGTVLFTTDLENNSYQYTFSDLGTYYWRVLTFDAAGNIGDYSAVRSLTIEE